MAKVSLLALACVAGLGLSGSLFAQSCSAPPAVNLAPAGSGTINLCSGTNFVTKFCVFTNSPSEDYAFSFIPSAGFGATGITLTNVSGGWTPEAVLQQTCGSISECLTSATAGTVAGNTALLDFTQSSTAVTAGATFFVLVTNVGTLACPTAETFSLVPNGTLPVKLSSFSID